MPREDRNELEARFKERTDDLMEINAELERHIAERKQAEEALLKNSAVVQLLVETATVSNQALSFEEAMRLCLELIRAHIGWPLGRIYLVSEGPVSEAIPTDIWYLDNPEKFEAFAGAEGLRFAPGVGLPARVLSNGKPAWISNMSTDRNFPRFEQAVDVGIRASLAFPILIRNDIVAIAEFFTTEILEPDERLLEVLLQVGAQLGRVVERDREEEKLNQLNEELESRNVELAHKNQEIEAFVYSVSHDLRSPLVNLEGFSEELGLVGEDLREIFESGDLPPETRRRGLELLNEDMATSIHYIRAGVKRLSDIIDTLLRLSRSGRAEYRWQHVDVGSVVEHVLDAMSNTIAEREAHVTIGDLPPAWGDPTQLERVFANLLSNALNYLDHERSGLIEVGYEERKAASDRSSGSTYYVKDNGVGIPERALEKVFQTFQRMHPEKAAGEGIGLTLVKRIVERHGGKIWVESTEGEGSTFFVRLPRDRGGKS